MTAAILSTNSKIKITWSVSHRKLLEHIIRTSLENAESMELTQVMVEIDKLGKVGGEKVRGKLKEIFGERIDLDFLFSKLEGVSFHELKDFFSEGEPAAAYEFLTRFSQLNDGASRVKYVIDLSLARGLGYYTGMVFECLVEGAESLGSISSGGRYDHLCDRFGREGMGGVGGSIGVDRLLAVFSHLGETEERI